MQLRSIIDTVVEIQAMRVLSKDQIEFIKKKLNTGGRI